MVKIKTPVLTDSSIMTFGKHKGKKLINIPAGWFIWAKNNLDRKSHTAPVLNYIDDNLRVIHLQYDKEKLVEYNDFEGYSGMDIY